ncbi:hypothetical protein [Actinomycetospora lemnae]|uniref:Uncharacterized protein n=1 Tax=Actinomycetospora lemnae TaxID=3019891 RepID=A0ABT5SZR5_9PSEU|nr:hypothetical protein [Actinomycetospora sp. DW7H6]MDD7968368.1 hypothetical protein [Actinomycetospora sp. DW7H6]
MTTPVDPDRRPGPAEVLGVPDLPAPILGWRTWRVGRRAQRRADLIAPLAGVVWPARRPMIAHCGSAGHSPPGDRCRCGLYAVSDPGTLEWGPSDVEVLGVVALWGQVVEGTRGWRASHGYPRMIVAGPGVTTEQRAALARRYGVPVHGAGLPAKALATQLSGDREAADRLLHRPVDETEAVLTERMPEWTRRWQARQACTAPRPGTFGRLWRRR